jgi:hypothetical protein
MADNDDINLEHIRSVKRAVARCAWSAAKAEASLTLAEVLTFACECGQYTTTTTGQ